MAAAVVSCPVCSTKLKLAALQEAMRLVAIHPLGTYDALQLAVALELKAQRALHGLPAPTFTSADLNLNNAAAAEGLAVEDPNRFPSSDFSVFVRGRGVPRVKE